MEIKLKTKQGRDILNKINEVSKNGVTNNMNPLVDFVGYLAAQVILLAEITHPTEAVADYTVEELHRHIREDH